MKNLKDTISQFESKIVNIRVKANREIYEIENHIAKLKARLERQK
jgi:hypothetical protein